MAQSGVWTWGRWIGVIAWAAVLATVGVAGGGVAAVAADPTAGALARPDDASEPGPTAPAELAAGAFEGDESYEPVPVPEPGPKAIRYHRSGRWLWAIARLWGLAVPAVVLATGLSTRLRDASWAVAGRLVPVGDDPGRVPRRRAAVRWLLGVATFGVLYLVLTAVVSLPLAWYAGFVRPHAYGLSNQTFGRWLEHWAIDVGVALAMSIPALWVVYGLIRVSPRRWWLAAGLLTVPVACAMAMVKPVLVDPLYNDFGPMQDKVLEAKILALAERAGVEGSRVYEVNMSRDTTAVNAYVTGFLGTKRIVLWDTLLEKLDDDQVLVVMAHELGHYVLGHVVRGLLVTSALTLIGLYAVHRGARGILGRYGARLGIERLADVASLPLLMGLGRLVALVLVPIGYGYSRHIEHEADRFALELTRANRAAATAFVTLQRENLSHPHPGWFDTFLRSTHPSLGARIDFSNTYRPWALGQPLRYAHLFQGPEPRATAATNLGREAGGEPGSAGPTGAGPVPGEHADRSPVAPDPLGGR